MAEWIWGKRKSHTNKFLTTNLSTTNPTRCNTIL